MTITTPEELDKHRARALCVQAGYDQLIYYDQWRKFLGHARALRAADEALGLSTEALLALINGEAVVVPKEPTEAMILAGDEEDKPAGAYSGYATEYARCETHYKAMLTASPYAKKEADHG